MRAGCWQAEPPCAEIPDDGCDEHCEDHRKSSFGADLQDQLDGQQRNNAEGNRAGGQQNPEEIEEPRPDHGDGRRERVRIDHRRDGIGRIMKAVDEFKPKCDQQSDAEQKERQDARDRGSRRRDVLINIPGCEEEPKSHDGEKDQDRLDPHRVIELWPRTVGLRGCDISRGKGRHRMPPGVSATVNGGV